METSNNGEGKVEQQIKPLVKEVGQEREFLRGGDAGKIPNSISEWQGWIKTNIENFEGKIENAAILMQSFTEGINYTLQLAEKGIVREFQYPSIYVTAGDNPDIPQIGCDSDGRTIIIKKAFLEKASTRNINLMLTSVSKHDEVVFEGTTRDQFLLSGIEEGLHSSDLQNVSNVPNNLGKAAAEYNADELEFRALRHKLIYAEIKGMPKETIAILNRQLEEARVERGRSKI